MYCDGCPECNALDNSQAASDAALDALRRKLTGISRRPHTVGYGRVTFQRFDGRTVVVDNVDVDGIGPDAGSAPGVISATREDETIVHLPFIESWTVEYDI